MAIGKTTQRLRTPNPEFRTSNFELPTPNSHPVNATLIRPLLLLSLLGLWHRSLAQCPVVGLDTLAYEAFEVGLPAGWSAPRSQAGARWQVNAGTIGYYPNPGSGQWLYINDEAANNVGRASVETPRYDLSAYQGDIELRCDLLFQAYADTGFFQLELWTAGQWQRLLRDSLDFAGTLRIDLSAYAGQTVALRITYDDGGSWGWGLGLDNFLLTGRVSTCGNGTCDPGETPGLCPEDCPQRPSPAPAWVTPDRDLQGQAVRYRHFKGGTRCDDCSEALDLSFDFTLFGQTYRQLWINANGNLSFGDAYKPYTPEPFCLHGPRMVAPFYADADLSTGGELRYYLDPAGHYLIVSWLGVGYYGCAADCELRNTFQVILTDGSVTRVGDYPLPAGTNVIFSYGDMQWTTGNSSGGVGGLGGSAATVGLNQGDGQQCEGYGRYDRLGYAHLPGSAGSNCPAGGVSHLDYHSLFFSGELGLAITPAPDAETEPYTSLFALACEVQGPENWLSWTLGSPGETTGFRIERAADGRTFEHLATLPLQAHRGQAEVRYQFADEAPLPGLNYYRVQQLGANGEVLHEATVQVMRGTAREAMRGPPLRSLRAQPNPFGTATRIQFWAEAAGAATYELHDLGGRLLRRGPLTAQVGDNEFPLSAGGLPDGVYLLNVSLQGSQRSLKLIRRRAD